MAPKPLNGADHTHGTRADLAATRVPTDIRAKLDAVAARRTAAEGRRVTAAQVLREALADYLRRMSGAVLVTPCHAPRDRNGPENGQQRTIGMRACVRCHTERAYCNTEVTRQGGQAMSPITADGSVVELTREEGREMLDERTRRLIGMPLEDFEALYEAGTLPDTPEVEHLVMLLPFAR